MIPPPWEERKLATQRMGRGGFGSVKWSHRVRMSGWTLNPD
jgi:hypothetical protein